MGKLSSSLATLIIGIALGLNFVQKLQPSTVTYILLALFILNSVTAKDLVNKNFQLGQALTESAGLQAQIVALNVSREILNTLKLLAEANQQRTKDLSG